MNLFDRNIPLNLVDATMSYHPNFIEKDLANQYFEELKRNVHWQQDHITLFGKTYAQPRLTALYGNNAKPYSYSNITMHPHQFKGGLLQIKEKVEKEVKTFFTSCLLNWYRDGRDSNGWHSDDEKELGPNPIIASVSLGTERYFHLRHKHQKHLKHKILLQHGSLLLMQGTTQHYWQHQIPKTTRKIGERINLTFRIIP